jgi:hypothetical protein
LDKWLFFYVVMQEVQSQEQPCPWMGDGRHNNLKRKESILIFYT